MEIVGHFKKYSMNFNYNKNNNNNHYKQQLLQVVKECKQLKMKNKKKRL